MRFRISSLFISLLTSCCLHAETHVVGATFRPQFFGHFFQAFATQESRPRLETSYRGAKLIVRLKGKLDAEKWVAIPESQRLSMSVAASDLEVEVEEASSGAKARLFWPSGHWRVSTDLASSELHISPPTTDVQFKSPEPSELLREINSSPLVRASLISAVLHSVAKEANRLWLQFFRKEVVMERISQLLSDLPLWEGRSLIDQGAIRLEVEPPSLAQQNLSFALYPRQRDFAMANPSQIDVFVNAAFLTDGDLRALLPESDRALDFLSVFTKAKVRLIERKWGDEVPFDRPRLDPSEAALSLSIPLALVNSALQKVYQEGLFRFRATIRLGERGKGVLTRDPLDVELVLAIRPDAAPSLSFAASDLQVNVKDYVMDLSTNIEDRLIPTESLRMSATIATQPGVDRNIYLALKPESFQLSMESLSRRLSEENLGVVKTLATSLWKDFLKDYSRLELFPAILDTGQLPAQIERIYTSGDYLILDANLNWEQFQWREGLQ